MKTNASDESFSYESIIQRCTSVRWECLTAAALHKARRRTGGVCVIVTGSLEKHSEHLPLGNDTLMGYAEALEAARREPAIVLPPLYFTQVHQAQNRLGAIAMQTPLLMAFLENLCDEAARNGFRRIILFNMHGGNRYWLPAAITEIGGKGKDYVVVLHTGPWDAGLASLRESKVEEKHAGELETSIAQALYPALVDPKAIPNRPGLPQRQGLLMGYTSVNWPTEFPEQYAGDARPSSAEKGRKVFEAVVENLARTIRAVKRDRALLSAVQRFNRDSRRPPAKRKGAAPT